MPFEKDTASHEDLNYPSIYGDPTSVKRGRQAYHLCTANALPRTDKWQTLNELYINHAINKSNFFYVLNSLQTKYTYFGMTCISLLMSKN